MKIFALAVLGLVFLGRAVVLPAQQPGDSIRVWTENGNMVGRLIHLDPLAVTFREFTAEQTIPRADIRRIDVWKPRNQAVEIAIDAVAFGLAAKSWNMNPLAGAAVGALIGVADVTLWPGRWRRVYRVEDKRGGRAGP